MPFVGACDDEHDSERDGNREFECFVGAAALSGTATAEGSGRHIVHSGVRGAECESAEDAVAGEMHQLAEADVDGLRQRREELAQPSARVRRRELVVRRHQDHR